MFFRQLEYLVALSNERHFVRAAQACGVSQPTLSEGIRRLEEELAVPLIRRGKRFEGLTAEGEQVLPWARRILADRDALVEGAGSSGAGLTGRLRMGAIPTASTAVSLISSQFHLRHPHASVQVVADLRSEDVLGRLLGYEIDAGLTYADRPVPPGFRVTPLYRERYVLLTKAENGHAGNRAATWAEAAELPLCLLVPEMQGRRQLDAAFAEAAVAPHPEVETDSVASLFAHVKAGRWATVLPCAWLHVFEVPEGMAAAPLVEPIREIPVGLVTLAQDPASAMALAAAEAAAEADLLFLEDLP